jgi:hypothetical protein
MKTVIVHDRALGSGGNIVSAQRSTLIGPKLAAPLQHEMLADVCFGSLNDRPLQRQGRPMSALAPIGDKTLRGPFVR